MSKKKKTRLALHWQILIGMALGIGVGVLAVALGDTVFLQVGEYENLDSKAQINAEQEGVYYAQDEKRFYKVTKAVKDENSQPVFSTKEWHSPILRDLVRNWIKPFGKIFVNLLKMIAIPLIIASLIKGVSDLKNISRLSAMGGRTIVLYLMTTVCAVTLGLFIVNVVNPGKGFSDDNKESLTSEFDKKAKEKIDDASSQKEKGPLQPLVDLVPENVIGASTSNGNMLKVIFFVILFGIGMILVDPVKAQPLKDFFEGLNDVVLKLIDLIMLAAPFGVFALLAGQVVETPTWSAAIALIKYGLCVVGGLGLMIAVFYPTIVFLFTRMSPIAFFKGIGPAQLLAFSTSSSAATLPVTMERVEEHLGVEKEVSSFVLPIGATVNMDGTSLYQAVAAVFIAQAYGINLDLGQQLTIVLTATLASIGSAAVPGAGMVMLVIVLGAIKVPEEGLVLIFAVDRILDMCRTTVNVTGDATVSLLVAKSVGKLGKPDPKDWDDNYPPDDAVDETLVEETIKDVGPDSKSND